MEKLKIPVPLEKPKDLGKVGEFTPKEYKVWKEREDKLRVLRWESKAFRERGSYSVEGKEGRNPTEEKIEEERVRRRQIGELQGQGAFSC